MTGVLDERGRNSAWADPPDRVANVDPTSFGLMEAVNPGEPPMALTNVALSGRGGLKEPATMLVLRPRPMATTLSSVRWRSR